MPEIRPSPFFLLACFAEFYEEVASIKLAIIEGRLSSYLTVGDEVPPTRGAELALRVSSRLAVILGNQARTIAAAGTAGEIKAHNGARYVMAALADEIFILDPHLEWAGREAWVEELLEYRIFRSQDAGERFFRLADQLLHSAGRDPLHADLASVFLLALQLGFKGRYRGEHGIKTLRDYRQRLYKFAQQPGHYGQDIHDGRHRAFQQAYQHLLKGERDERRAPLSRWYALGRIAFGVYLALSTLVWVVLMYPFEKVFGG